MVLMVALGAIVGAPGRYLIDRFVQTKHEMRMPWGTFTVNMIASLLLGLLAGFSVSPTVAALLGTGFCGSLSTYSTFAFETVRLRRSGQRWVATTYAASSVAAGLLAAALGYLVGHGVR